MITAPESTEPDQSHNIPRGPVVIPDDRPLVCIDLRESHQFDSWESCDPAYDDTGWSRR